MKKLFRKFFGRKAKMQKKENKFEHPFFQSAYDAYILGSSTQY